MNLIKSSSIYLFSSILSAGFSIFMIPIYTSVMSPSEYGIYGLLLVINSIITILIGGNLFIIIQREYYRIEDKFNFYMNVVFYFLFSYFFIVIFLFLISHYLLEFLNLNVDFYWIIIISILSLEQIFIQFYLTLLKLKDFAFVFLEINLFLSLSNMVIGYFLVVIMGYSWKGILISYIISSFFVLMFVFAKVYNHIEKINLDKGLLKDFFKFTLSYLPTTLNWRIISFSDRFFITKMISIETLGLYTLGYQISNSLSLITQSFNNAFGPYFMKNMKNNNKSNFNIFVIIFFYVIFLIFILSIVYFLIPLIVKYFFSSDYLDSLIFFNYFLIIIFFTSLHQIVSKFLVFYKIEKYISVSTTIGMLFNLLLNYVLIKEHGAVGAVEGTAVSYIVIISTEVYFIIKYRRKINV